MTLLAAAHDRAIPPTRTPLPAVHIQGLNKLFPVRRPWLDTIARPFRRQRTAVLQEVSLDVPPGEFFGLLGPNGAGKSTLFKILSSLILPDSGTVRVNGYDCVEQASEVRRELAAVTTDDRSLYWRLSARENLRVYAALHRLRGAALHDRVEELLSLVELTDTGDQMVGKFSSGMKQRLLIARALLSRPSVLLLDEPTRSLDPISAGRLRGFLRNELAGQQGCTILLATHNAEEAFGLCDRVGVLHRGRLLRVGSPHSLQEELRDQRYRLWVRASDWHLFSSLVQLRTAVAARRVEEGEWTVGEVQLAGGEEAVAGLVSDLVHQGVDVARCEPVQLSLAALIERIVSGSGRGAADA